MRQAGVVLRLTADGLSARQIALSLGVARSTVSECLRRASEAGLAWAGRCRSAWTKRPWSDGYIHRRPCALTAALQWIGRRFAPSCDAKA